MLETTRVQQDGALRLPNPARSSLDRFRWNASNLGCSVRVPLFGVGGHILKTCCVPTNELAVFKTVAQDDMQHAEQQGEVSAGTQRKIQIRITRDRGHARIGDYQSSAMIAAAPYIVGRDRGALADVGPDNKQDFGLGNLAPRNCAAVDPERQLVRGPRRNHAEAAVVVDVPGSQRDASKLAEQIRFLGGERCSPVNSNGIFAVLVLNFTHTPNRDIERLVPTCWLKTVVAAHQRSEQAIGVAALHVALYALRAKHAAVEWEVLPRLETNNLILANFELDATLLSAEAT